MSNRSLTLLFASLAFLLPGCGKNQAPEPPARDEYIKVYEVSEEKLVNDIQVPFGGVQDGKIHVLSNVRTQWRYLIDQDEPDQDWFTIKSVEEVEPGHTVVTYDAASLLPLNSLDRRGGRLSFSCPEASLGKFLSVRQGYSEHFVETFSEEPDGTVKLTGKQTFTTPEYAVLNADYFDYISFNAWAETKNEFLSKNITLDITVSGGQFYATGMTTYRVNVPVGTAPDPANFKYLLVMGNGERMSAKTTFTFSTANDDDVYVHIDNFAAYQVTEADMVGMFDDEDFMEEMEEEEPDWI